MNYSLIWLNGRCHFIYSSGVSVHCILLRLHFELGIQIPSFCLLTDGLFYFHIHTNIQTHAHSYTYILKYTPMHSHWNTYTYLHVHKQSHTCTQRCIKHIHLHMCIHIHMHIPMHILTYTEMHTRINIYNDLHKHEYTKVYMHICVSKHIDLHTYTYTCIHVYTHTCTHKSKHTENKRLRWCQFFKDCYWISKFATNYYSLNTNVFNASKKKLILSFSPFEFKHYSERLAQCNG